MKKYLLVQLFAAVVAVSAIAQSTPLPQSATKEESSAQAAWPSTEAGRLAAEWVKVVNSKDLATYTAFLKAHVSTKLLRGRDPDEVAKGHMRMNMEMAPVELAAVTKSEKFEVSANLRVQGGDAVQFFVQVDPENPTQALALRLERGGGKGPAAASRMPDVPLGKENVRQMCSTAASAIATAFVDREKAPQYADELRERCDSGEFDSTTKRTFQRQFTDALRAITNDKHMYIMYRAEDDSKPAATNAAVEEAMARLKKEYGHGAEPFTPSDAKPSDSNWGEHGIEEVKMLDGNIGYIKASMFPDIEEGAGPAAAAMREVAGAKALIFDLRNMRGGSQELVNLFCSYLFADPHKLLVTMRLPALNTRDEQFTYAKLNGTRMPNVPVYILTNHSTFSAGEAFAYTLQQFKRATVVGETTGGGGHFNEFVSLGQGMNISVSVGTVTHPVSNQGWEGVGVVPDVQVAPAEALDRALSLAKEKLSATSAKGGM